MMLSTIVGVLFINIEWGIIIGVLLSLVIFYGEPVSRTSRWWD
ncbi:hypothetical protein ACT691_15215 [Vibrio metschnikovii]